MIQNTNYGASKSYVDGALSNTYTKAEVDTALARKANDGAVVHKAGAETIPGAKTFTNEVKINATRPTMTGICGYAVDARGASDSSPVFMDMDRTYDSSGVNYIREVSVRNYQTFRELYLTVYDKAGSTSRSASVYLRASATDNYAYMTAPSRAYNANNPSAYANDVVTFSNIGGYPNFVRTDGNQTKAGTLTLTSSPLAKSTNIDRTTVATQQPIGQGIAGVDTNGKNLFILRPTRPANTRQGRLQIGTYTEDATGNEKFAYLDLVVNDNGKVDLRVYSPYDSSFHTIYKDA